MECEIYRYNCDFFFNNIKIIVVNKGCRNIIQLNLTSKD